MRPWGRRRRATRLNSWPRSGDFARLLLQQSRTRYLQTTNTFSKAFKSSSQAYLLPKVKEFINKYVYTLHTPVFPKGVSIWNVKYIYFPRLPSNFTQVPTRNERAWELHKRHSHFIVKFVANKWFCEHEFEKLEKLLETSCITMAKPLVFRPLDITYFIKKLVIVEVHLDTCRCT